MRRGQPGQGAALPSAACPPARPPSPPQPRRQPPLTRARPTSRGPRHRPGPGDNSAVTRLPSAPAPWLSGRPPAEFCGAGAAGGTAGRGGGLAVSCPLTAGGWAAWRGGGIAVACLPSGGPSARYSSSSARSREEECRFWPRGNAEDVPLWLADLVRRGCAVFRLQPSQATNRMPALSVFH